MDQVYIIDNWLEENLAEYITEIHIKTIPFTLSQVLSDGITIGGHHFDKNLAQDTWRAKLDGNFYTFQNSLIDFLYFKIKKIFNFSVGVYRSYINFYPPKIHDSLYHTDHTVEDTDFTVLYMCSKTPTDNSGSFEYIDPKTNDLTTINYLHNRLIVFKGTTLHRGLSFNDDMRTTITFKCFKIDENSTDN